MMVFQEVRNIAFLGCFLQLNVTSHITSAIIIIAKLYDYVYHIIGIIDRMVLLTWDFVNHRFKFLKVAGVILFFCRYGIK